MSILIDSVRIAAFGGIRLPLSLDLTAPLTLVYAPNGTGKTSVIESVDWMMGGEVRGERCKLADDDEQTEVTIAGLVSGSVLSARKSLRSNGRTSRTTNGTPVGEADFLKSLAPECDVSGLNPLTQIPRLKAYLSSNRVLGISSLSRLIDEENAEARADAMADLTGTRAQRNAQKVIDLYRKRLRERLSKLRSEHENLISRQKEFRELSSSRFDADALTAEVARILSVTEPVIGREHEELTIQASRELNDLDSRTETLKRLRELVQSPPVYLDLAALEQRISGVEAEIRSVNQLLEEDAERSQLLSEQVGGIARDIEGVQIVIDALGHLQSAVGEDTSFGSLYTARQKVTLSALDPKEASDQLIALASASVQARADVEARARLESTVAFLIERNLSSQARESLELALAEKRRDLAKSREGRETILSFRNDAVRSSLVAHQHDQSSSDCPACGHNWGSHEGLERALNRVLSSLPTLEANLVAQEASLVIEIDQLKARAEMADDHATQLGHAMSELARVNRSIEQADRLAARFAFESAEAVGDSDLSNWRRELSLASALLDFERARSSSHIVYHPASSDSLRDGISRLGSSLTALRKGIEQQRPVMEDAAYSISIREGKIASLSGNLARLRSQYVECDTWMRRKGQLQDVLGLGSVSKEHLDAVELSLVQRRDSVRAAVKLLAQANEIRASSELAGMAELALSEADAVARDILSIESELTRIDGIDDRIEQQSDLFRQQLIETVGPSVSQLFQRMQVNRVFSSVAVSSTFELKGSINDHLLEPELFSSGQRQDLGLAFFLVRAYALGGSFFLDEPLAHLDDLNRVAVLDTLRAFVLASRVPKNKETRLVITTASWTTAKHVMQKFMRIKQQAPLLRAYQLTGNVSSRVGAVELYPSPPDA